MDEDEAALLAELRAISNKSAASRFTSEQEEAPKEEKRSPSNGDRTDHLRTVSPPNEEDAAIEATEPDLDDLLGGDANDHGDAGALGSHHDTGDMDTSTDDVFHDALKSPEKLMPLEDAAVDAPKKEDSSTTFQGERSGAAEDAELLALLKGISAQSKSADRFADEIEENNNSNTESTVSPATREKPWKEASRPLQGSAENSDKVAPSDSEALAAARQADETATRNQPPEVPGMAMAGNFKKESNFQGERGGTAEDPELLALLRGVSAQSASADRFATSDQDENNVVVSAPAPKPALSKNSRRGAGEVPPWKRGNKASARAPPSDDVVVVAAPQTTTTLVESTPARPTEETLVVGGKGSFKRESTFSGERGGAAEDEELLALLRGVSAKSSSADRFKNQDCDAAVPEAIPVVETKPQARATSKKLPPWKKDKQKAMAASNQETTVAVPTTKDVAPNAKPLPEEGSLGGDGTFSQKSSFMGERGGDAQDEELLALLRGVSAKAGGADRFADDLPVSTPAPAPITAASKPPEASSKELQMGGAGNFKQESTFQGERGGAAEDEELLALLRGVSAKASGGGRFGENSSVEPPQASAAPKVTQPAAIATPAMSMSSSAPPSATDNDIEVTRDNLAEYIRHSNWKLRRDSYILLTSMILEASNGREPSGSLSGDAVLSGLDDKVPVFLMDKNATALEEALELATVYADYCAGGQSAELAASIAVKLIKGSAFTSPRPKAIKRSQALVLKLMEVGNDNASINAIMGVFLEEGISSKKPKIVQMAMSLILEAAQGFGAASLPLAAIKAPLPKMLAHSNKKIRDTALEVVAELCRALGGKSAISDVIENMKKPQVKDLDDLLKSQPEATDVKIGIRSRKNNDSGAAPSAGDALAALNAGNAELEAELFAKRPAVNLPEEVLKSNYSEHLQLSKWSEKVTGLKIILECAGEKPYKLLQPSADANYAPLISEMKGLLKHTHFAVVTKALEVLAMMAQGAGEKLYPNLRPLLSKLFSLSKDKKLTKPVALCLDAFFGNVLSFDHILDCKSALPEATSEQSEKNSLARTMALEFLERSVARCGDAGPRGEINSSRAKLAADLAAEKLADSDAAVRKAALNVLIELKKVDDLDSKHTVQAIIDGLEKSNPRAYKQLGNISAPPTSIGIPRPFKASSPANSTRTTNNVVAAPPKPRSDRATKALPTVAPKKAGPGASLPSSASPSDVPAEEATEYVAALGISQWDSDVDDGGVLAGLESTKWLHRQNAIQAIASFISDRETPSTHKALERDTTCILVLVKQHTRGFNETNVQVSKSIMELFIAICDCHEEQGYPVPTWVALAATNLGCSKIADKKLSPMSKSLLLSTCVVAGPRVVTQQAYETMVAIKSPVAHEEFLKWMKTFAEEFGSGSLGAGLKNAVAFLCKECESANLKVKKAAHAALGVVHVHLGAPLEGLVFASVTDNSLREQLGKVFSEHPHDPSTANFEWPKRSIIVETTGDAGTGSSCSGNTHGVELPTLDLVAELSADCIVRMGSKEGKTSWKARKAAMEEVDSVMRRCVGLLDTTTLRPLVDLLRALRDRLSDSQSNLKPVAARLIGQILSATDAVSQAKLGKVVFGPLINAAMNDSRKIMHDAALEALQIGTSRPKMEGGTANEQVLEPFLIGLVGELDESDFKNTGIADVLDLTKSFASLMPDLDGIASQGGNTLGSRLAKVIVNGLSSSKADIRSSSESLLEASVVHGAISLSTVKKVVARQKPAAQRALTPIIHRLSSSSSKKDRTESQVPEGKIRSNSSTTKSNIETTNDPSTRIRPSLAARKMLSREDTTSAIPKSNLESHRISSVSNPLVSSSGAFGVQKSKAAIRSMTWPEYPEEPSGSLLLTALKKVWTPLLPPESAKKLFPEGGIKKQDDAMDGFALLSRAIVMERADEGCAIGEQFGVIWKWITFVLCCKESTVGTQALLQLIFDLFEHLRSIKYTLSDIEAMVFVPHLFDKGSAAKGRFKDTYMDLIENIKSEDLLPTKILGPMVCVSVIEGSSHPKARLLACKECLACVEMSGLSGVGKRGVLAVAKSLSEEKLQENRNILIELASSLVLRMNGDVQRFTRICGSSLSTKARSLIEERLKKDGAQPPSTTKSRKSISGVGYGTPSRALNSTSSTFPATATKKSTFLASMEMQSRATVDEDIKDELPALDLRVGSLSTPTIPRTSDFQSSMPSALSFSQRPASLDTMKGTVQSTADYIDSAVPSPSEEERESLRSTLFTSSSNESEGSLGAAASLRARLMKIRERNKQGTVSISVENPSQSDILSDSPPKANEENYGMDSSTDQGPFLVDTASPPADTASYLDVYLSSIRGLLAREPPLSEEDADIIHNTDILKSIHAAVSQQPGLAVNLDVNEVNRLRKEIIRNSNEVVETLTRLIGFGFRCHGSDCNAGVSVPLLSVNLASLMAIFRSEDIAKTTRVEELTVLIKEAGKALLDPRLSASSPRTSLDEATSVQMVRAINKLAVQAATGSTRHFAFEALLSLQQQLCLKSDPTEDPLFNSRLSRVVSKLFSRVVKAEEGAQHPFSSRNVDLEAVVCVLEDTLSACDAAEGKLIPEAIAATKNLGVVLVTAVLKAQGGAHEFRQHMGELDIHSEESSIGKLVSEISEDLGLNVSSEGLDINRQPSSVEVASLVSAVGEAAVGADRDAAVAALKAYKAEHGDEDLNDHLKNVSAAFKAFILEQLSEHSHSSEAEKPTPSSMSERIRSLRSKLSATEAVVHSAVERTNKSTSLDSSKDNLPETKPTQKTGSSSNIQAFRDRLAAARSTSGTDDLKEIPETTTTAGSRAAALRARLQAVKRQNEL